jgi:hypothetical protein
VRDVSPHGNAHHADRLITDLLIEHLVEIDGQINQTVSRRFWRILPETTQVWSDHAMPLCQWAHHVCPHLIV